MIWSDLCLRSAEISNCERVVIRYGHTRRRKKWKKLVTSTQMPKQISLRKVQSCVGTQKCSSLHICNSVLTHSRHTVVDTIVKFACVCARGFIRRVAKSMTSSVGMSDITNETALIINSRRVCWKFRCYVSESGNISHFGRGRVE